MERLATCNNAEEFPDNRDQQLEKSQTFFGADSLMKYKTDRDYFIYLYYKELIMFDAWINGTTPKPKLRLFNILADNNDYYMEITYGKYFWDDSLIISQNTQYGTFLWGCLVGVRKRLMPNTYSSHVSKLLTEISRDNSVGASLCVYGYFLGLQELFDFESLRVRELNTDSILKNIYTIRKDEAAITGLIIYTKLFNDKNDDTIMKAMVVALPSYFAEKFPNNAIISHLYSDLLLRRITVSIDQFEKSVQMIESVSILDSLSIRKRKVQALVDIKIVYKDLLIEVEDLEELYDSKNVMIARARIVNAYNDIIDSVETTAKSLLYLIEKKHGTIENEKMFKELVTSYPDSLSLANLYYQLMNRNEQAF